MPKTSVSSFAFSVTYFAFCIILMKEQFKSSVKLQIQTALSLKLYKIISAAAE